MNLKYFFIAIAVNAVIAGVISYFADIPFFAIFALCVVAMFLNGLLAEFEDNRPGGFNYTGDNKKKKRKDQSK